jgi:hypothetical protein
MTASLTRTLRQAGLVLAFAVSLSVLSSTQSFAFSAEAQEMCTGDAFRLCSSEIPNISKITACMMKIPDRSERRLPNRDGPGSGPEVQQGCGSVIGLANGSRECSPDDRFRGEAVQSLPWPYRFARPGRIDINSAAESDREHWLR